MVICSECGSYVDCSKKHKFCLNGVPKSFATGTELNKVFSNLQGYGISEDEKIIYRNRMNKLKEIDIGEYKTIKELKESGFKGTEFRDALNYSICRGRIIKTRKIRRKTKKGEFLYYEVFERVNKSQCNYLYVKRNDNNEIEINCKYKDFKVKENGI